MVLLGIPNLLPPLALVISQLLFRRCSISPGPPPAWIGRYVGMEVMLGVVVGIYHIVIEECPNYPLESVLAIWIAAVDSELEWNLSFGN